MDGVLRERTRSAGRMVCLCAWVGMALGAGAYVWLDRDAVLVSILFLPLAVTNLLGFLTIPVWQFVVARHLLAADPRPSTRWVALVQCVVAPVWLGLVLLRLGPWTLPVVVAYAACCTAVAASVVFALLAGPRRPPSAREGPRDAACVAAAWSLWALASVHAFLFLFVVMRSAPSGDALPGFFWWAAYCALLGWLAHAVGRGRALFGAGALMGTVGFVHTCGGLLVLAGVVSARIPVWVGLTALFVAVHVAAIVLVFRAVLRLPPAIAAKR